MRTVIRDALIVTQDATRRVIRGDIGIEGGRFVEIGKVRDSGDVELDAAGGIAMPGLINTHTHVSMSIMKGVADDMLFPDFLDTVFRYDSKREERDIFAGTRLGCLEMIRGGTTTLVDFYYSEDVIAKGVGDAGVRGVLCWAVLDEEFTTQKGSPMQNCRRFCESHDGMERIIPGVALQGVYVCNEETCQEAAAYALESDRPLTFHLSETRKEVNDHKRKTGMRPAEWLEHIGALNHKGIAAHSAWLTINEVRALARNGVSVSSCPVSNMKLATGGVAPIPEMLENGVTVTMGTDGSTTNNSLDMFFEMKVLGLLQKSNRWDASVLPAQRLLDMATVDAASAIGMADSLGSIEVGKLADVILLDPKAPNLRPLRPENVVSNIVYSSSSLNVMTVICQGDIIMRDREVLSMDEEEVLSAADEAMNELIGRV
jgi:5-methylthioadenosine/S-adenosylhomocysteine deaminase